MKEHGEKLSRNQELAIAALLLHASMSEAADADTSVQRAIPARQAGGGQAKAVGHPQRACSVAVLALTDIAQDVSCWGGQRLGFLPPGRCWKLPLKALNWKTWRLSGRIGTAGD